jgi:hypothetical protein
MIRIAMDGLPCSTGLCYGYTAEERAAHVPGRAIDPGISYLNRNTVLLPAQPSEADFSPMNSAPRDGISIRVLRRPHPNTKRHIVRARWITRTKWVPGAEHRGFWRLDNGQAAQDDDLLGWKPIIKGQII